MPNSASSLPVAASDWRVAQEFGRGFEARNLRRMVKFAEAFPDTEILSTLSAKLSWSHSVTIVALKTRDARHFSAQQAAQNAWSVSDLSHLDRIAAEGRAETKATTMPQWRRESG